MNEDQEEIIKYCYNKAINELQYSISLENLLGVEVFSEKNIRLIIRELRNLDSDGKIKLSGNFPIENKELVFIAITLRGLLYWEGLNQAIDPIFTELTKKYLTFVRDVELGKIKINKGIAAQFGTIAFNELSKLLEEPSKELIIYVQQKADSLFTQRIGFSSKTGFIFYGKNEPFLTIEGEDFLNRLELKESYGKWRVIKSINRGGQGFVFKAKKEGDENDYALKSYRVRRNSPKQQLKIKRFQSEVNALEAIAECTNVIKLIDKGGIAKKNESSDYYFVMELADQTLDQYIRKSQFNFNEILRLFSQILDAFECINKKGIIHRDIKPQNILIKNDEIKVSDFGINYRITDDRVTPENDVVGPRFFICPESEDGRVKEPDIRCDIYSLGKLLYYLLSNGKRFAREKYEEAEYNLHFIHNDYRYNAFLPLFEKTMNESRDERYSNIFELKKGFEKSVERFHYIPLFVKLYFRRSSIQSNFPDFVLKTKYIINDWVKIYFNIKIGLAKIDLPFFMEFLIQDRTRYGISCVFFNVIDSYSVVDKLWEEVGENISTEYYEGDYSFNDNVINLQDAIEFTEKINKLIKDFSLSDEDKFHEYIYNKKKFYALLDAYNDSL